MYIACKIEIQTSPFFSIFGCQISVTNFIRGGRKGYSLGKYRCALKNPPSLRVKENILILNNSLCKAKNRTLKLPKIFFIISITIYKTVKFKFGNKIRLLLDRPIFIIILFLTLYYIYY